MNKTWSNLRGEINKLCSELNISPSEFQPVNSIYWESIFSTIKTEFLYQKAIIEQPSWLWSELKVDKFVISCSKDPYKYLNLLINRDKTIYFLVNETLNEQTKYWLYEGKIDAIISIISEAQYLDEYYLISKKYNWFLCVNHHDSLIGTGEVIPKMKVFKEKIQ